MLGKTEHMIWLMDFYQAMLTEKQHVALKLYYEENLTLNEIGEEMGISRQAVHDLVQRSGNILLELEEKLSLVTKFRVNQDRVAQMIKLVERAVQPPEKEELLAHLQALQRSLSDE